MGWLDNSTNNIIIDAVLTDFGRQQLAVGGGASAAFNISHFALGDDEVDYGIITKYGRTVGKEKIEKNTPVFEALTNQSNALKYPLISMPQTGDTVNTVYMPYLVSPTSTIALSSNNPQSTVSLTLYYRNSTIVPPAYMQGAYSIYVSDRFFYLTGGTGGTLNTSAASATASVDPADPNRTATYKLSPNSNANNQSIGFTINAKSIDNTTLSIYGKATSSTSRVITNYITIVGDKGCRLTIPVTYTATLL